MSARALVVGLDGFDLGIVQELGPERLPQIHALMARGAFAALSLVLVFHGPVALADGPEEKDEKKEWSVAEADIGPTTDHT